MTSLPSYFTYLLKSIETRESENKTLKRKKNISAIKEQFKLFLTTSTYAIFKLNSLKTFIQNKVYLNKLFETLMFSRRKNIAVLTFNFQTNSKLCYFNFIFIFVFLTRRKATEALIRRASNYPNAKILLFGRDVLF